jgi:hypothetical protein
MTDDSHKNSPSSNVDLAQGLETLNFLLGDWEAIGEPGEAKGGFRFVSQLQSRVIVRTNYAEYPATTDLPTYRHDDLMIVYYDEMQGLRADYYDSEGHVIRYAGQASPPNRVVFTSEPTASGPGFRLSYQLGENGILAGTFEIASLNQPGGFAPFLSWSAHRHDQS